MPNWTCSVLITLLSIDRAFAAIATTPRAAMIWTMKNRNLLLLVIIILLIVLLLPTWPYSAGFGYYPSGGLGLVLLVLLLLIVLGKL